MVFLITMKHRFRRMPVEIGSPSRDYRVARTHLPKPVAVERTLRAMVRDFQDGHRFPPFWAKTVEPISLHIRGKKYGMDSTLKPNNDRMIIQP